MNFRSLLGSWAAPLLIHNQNQNTAMIRAAAAKAQGLDPNVYGVPLPGSNVTTTNNQSGFVKGAVISRCHDRRRCRRKQRATGHYIGVRQSAIGFRPAGSRSAECR